MGILEDLANKKNIAISYDIPADVEIFADRTMLEAIIRNIASNAIKFTHENGKVSFVSKLMPDNSIKISVSDTGIGMSREEGKGSIFYLTIPVKSQKKSI